MHVQHAPLLIPILQKINGRSNSHHHHPWGLTETRALGYYRLQPAANGVTQDPRPWWCCRHAVLSLLASWYSPGASRAAAASQVLMHTAVSLPRQGSPGPDFTARGILLPQEQKKAHAQLPAGSIQMDFFIASRREHRRVGGPIQLWVPHPLPPLQPWAQLKPDTTARSSPQASRSRTLPCPQRGWREGRVPALAVLC